MITKIYGVFGYREACLTVPVSNDAKTYLKISFTNGNPQHGAYYRPATYVCADSVEQRMIENSCLFGNTIVLYKQFGTEEVAPEKEAEVQEEPVKVKRVKSVKTSAESDTDNTGKEYADVTTIEGVRAVLKAAGAKATMLADNDKMQAFAQEKGISFPNFNF